MCMSFYYPCSISGQVLSPHAWRSGNSSLVTPHRKLAEPDKRIQKVSPMPNIHSLPETLLLKICAGLNDLDLCKMELVSKRFHDFLSKPAPGEFWLSLWNFCPPTPEKFRWLERRILRYQYIESWFTHDEVEWTYECGTVPPVLPSLLAICAPSAELTLKIDAFQSESFFEHCAATYGCRPELISFRADLIRHLTVLELMLDFGKHDAQDLEDLGMFEALRRLSIVPLDPEYPCSSLAEQSVALKLPSLASLRLGCIEEGEFVLSCPKLKAMSLDGTSLHIKVEEAALTCLWLDGSKDVQVDLSVDQLESLCTLTIKGRNEVGKRLTEDVCHMRNLKHLELLDFPSEHIPKSFPQSLQDLHLEPFNWCQDLPGGLNDLCNLKAFQFRCADDSCEFWDIARPLGHFLPIYGLKYMELGKEAFLSKEIKDIGSKANIRCTNGTNFMNRMLKMQVLRA